MTYGIMISGVSFVLSLRNGEGGDNHTQEIGGRRGGVGGNEVEQYTLQVQLYMFD